MSQVLQSDASFAPDDLPENPTVSYRPSQLGGGGYVATEGDAPANPATWRTLYHEQMETMAAGTDSRSGVAGESTPTEAGKGAPFAFRRMIGRGGYGEVWEAVQVSLGRAVAVKRLRVDLAAAEAKAQAETHSGHAQPGQLERLFRQEALTTALLQHPNIVPIHEMGLDEQGKPLLAMKLVRGTPWDLMLTRDQGLPFIELLDKHLPVLIAVGQAVAFAHSRGIVHRDLKPAQVIAGEFGEVMLMDWGLALLFDENAASTGEDADGPAAWRHLPTTADASSPAGTPAYMAPEQTQESATNIGPWTDVYLLGGILYYILTGTPPHAATSSPLAFWRATKGIIERPHQRAPGREIPPELEALALHAMQREPGDRVPSAAAFVQALVEYQTGASKRSESMNLAREAALVLAKPSPGYRQFSEVLVMLEKAQALWPGNAEAGALKASALEGHARAALRNGDLVLARLQAERLGASAVTVHLLNEVNAAEQAIAGREKQRRQMRWALVALALVLVAGVAKYAIDQNAANELLRQQRDRATRARGDAESLVDYMLTDMRNKLVAIGQTPLLDDAARKAVKYFEEMPPEDSTHESRLNHVNALLQAGDTRLQMADRDSGGECFRQALSISQEVAGEDPGNVKWQRMLAGCHDRLGEYARLEGDLAGALEHYRHSLRILRFIQPSMDPGDHDAQRNVSVGLLRTGTTLRMLGRHEEAMKELEECLRLRQDLSSRFPNSHIARLDLSTAHDVLSSVLLALGLQDEALSHSMKALEIQDELLLLEPDNNPWLRNKSIAETRLGEMLWSAGRLEAALPHLRAGSKTAAELIRHDPSNFDWRNVEYWALKVEGNALIASGSAEEAIVVLERQCARAAETAPLVQDELDWHLHWANAEDSLGIALEMSGDYVKSLHHLENARAIRQQVIDAGVAAEDVPEVDQLSNAYSRARAMAGLKRSDEAVALMRQAERDAKVLATGDHAAKSTVRQAWINTRIRLAVILAMAGRGDEAMQSLEEVEEDGGITTGVMKDMELQPLRGMMTEEFDEMAERAAKREEGGEREE